MHLLRWLRPGSHTISPTAFYTGQVWQAHGLGHPALAPALGSLPGRVGYAATELAFRPVTWSGGPTLTGFLLARHRIIDTLLERAVASGEVGQVVELAAGLSPRGLRLRAAHPEVDYVEVDLPDMTARKRRALERAGVDPARHRAVAADVFGPELDELFASLDARRGVAVVTEGLLNYFPTPTYGDCGRGSRPRPGTCRTASTCPTCTSTTTSRRPTGCSPPAWGWRSGAGCTSTSTGRRRPRPR